MNKKAVVLFSGGLDSILAIKLMLDQEVEVHALYFSSVFNQGNAERNKEAMRKKAKALGIAITIIDITKNQLELIKDPKYGMGRNMNPCIDCRIMTLKKAEELMRAIGASFIVTGEVVGERPMSQRKDALLLIDRKSGLGGLIVRPLSAKLLEITLPEKEKLLDRDKLFDIQGRKRNMQITLAKRFGINDYPNPSGGCLLTDKGFSSRLKDILKYNQCLSLDDLNLLKIGRHFRISDKVKLVVGRDEKENNLLTSMLTPGDYFLDIPDIPSAVGLGRGEVKEEDIKQMAAIIARYSDVNPGSNVEVSYNIFPCEDKVFVAVNPSIDLNTQPVRL